MKQRFEYVDLMKGISIMLVVLGHLTQANTVESCHHPIFNFIYSFHMPLFMFIGGYIAYKTYVVDTIKSGIKGIAQKGRSLFIPYFTWQLLVSNYFLTNGNSSNLFIDFIKLLTQWSPLWFLFYVFLFYFFYTVYLLLLNKSKYKNSKLFELIFFFIIWGLLFILSKLNYIVNIDSYLLYALFFYSGILFSKYNQLTKVMTDNVVFFIGTIIFLTLVGYYNYFDNGNFNKLIKIIISAAAIVIVYNISLKTIKQSFIINRLKIYGTNSLAIYVTHFSMWYLLKDKAFINDLSTLYTLFILLVMSIIVIETCILIKRLVSYSLILDFILYGVKFNSKK